MNQLKVHTQQSILTLAGRGWSKRRIARELGLDRATVRKYLAEASKPPTPQTGSGDCLEAKSPTPPQTGSSGVPQPSSVCDPWDKEIEAAWQAGLTVQRIYQDLVVEHQFTGSYHAVRRFVRRRLGAVELPFRRMECEPGQELQVDFGRGAWVVEEGKRRRPHLFRCVLSHSRKAYSEVVWRQTSESFIRCLENAFRHFGGVTATVVSDYVSGNMIDLLFHPCEGGGLLIQLRHGSRNPNLLANLALLRSPRSPACPITSPITPSLKSTNTSTPDPANASRSSLTHDLRTEEP